MNRGVLNGSKLYHVMPPGKGCLLFLHKTSYQLLDITVFKLKGWKRSLHHVLPSGPFASHRLQNTYLVTSYCIHLFKTLSMTWCLWLSFWNYILWNFKIKWKINNISGVSRLVIYRRCVQMDRTEEWRWITGICAITTDKEQLIYSRKLCRIHITIFNHTQHVAI